MCLGIPMKVVAKNGDEAEVELGGLKRTVSLALMEDVSVGDFLIIHAGFAIERLDKEEALKTIEDIDGLWNGSDDTPVHR